MKIDDLDKMGVKMWEDNQPKTLVNKVFDEELFNDAVRHFSELGWIAAILAVSSVISITTHIKYLITGKI